MFEIDPDKPDIPALARILSAMGMLCPMGSVISAMLAFSNYEWLNETYAMAGAVGAFLVELDEPDDCAPLFARLSPALAW